MGEVFIDESGRPLEIRAYVARFNEPSVPLPEHSGAVETIAPFAFSPVTADLAAGRVPPPILDAEHEPGWQILAAGDADFDVWQDAVGFAVAISNINVSARTLAFLKWIGSRQRPAMSFAGQWLYAAGSREAGRPRILAVNELRSISITDRPAYRSTAVWLSTNTAHDLRRSDAYALLATWQEGREATTKARAGVAAAARVAVPAAAHRTADSRCPSATATAAAAAGMSMQELEAWLRRVAPSLGFVA